MQSYFGYEEVIVQDILLKTDNVLFSKEKCYSLPLAQVSNTLLTKGYEGEFGLGIKALIMSLYYDGNMSEGKLLEFLSDIGISMLAGYLLLIRHESSFVVELKQVYRELFLVVEYLELPWYNNPAELAARTMVLRRSISYATQTFICTKAWDIFMSLVDTTRKLDISFFEHISDHISQAGIILPLATMICDQASLHFWGWSWSMESLPTN
ncbi:hypothetical protein Tery_0942 [Trichodesmium erythraeum IMS101]|uniref:Uncharacterized protein n=1 Tax=Trichodesmium erythraeum (strain IMS101) TaxID=203124 RepID=Q117I9_TRIEI|nr:hypothetical protein [Trichodesmium erythraeum GBRTRLIN201]MDE5095205.1 hypothetical protein [Trichodesmium sp. St11_bin5]